MPTPKPADEASPSRGAEATPASQDTIIDWTEVGAQTPVASDVGDMSLRGFLTGDRTWFKAVVAVVALIASLIGVAGGSLALVDHWKREHPDLTINVAHDIFDDPHILRVEIVNDSAAAATLVGGAVLLGDYQVGAVLATIDAGAEGLNDGSRTRLLPAATRPLPFSIPAGSSFSGALVWDEGSAFSPGTVRAFTRAVDHAGAEGANRLRVRLEFQPGGSKMRPIKLPATRLEDRMRAPFGHVRGWDSQPVLDRERSVKGLRLDHAAAAPAVGLLRLWKAAGSKPLHRSTRPLVAGRRSTFTWDHLRPGRYDWAVSTDAGVVATGTFVTPCTPDLRVEAALMCADLS